MTLAMLTADQDQLNRLIADGRISPSDLSFASSLANAKTPTEKQTYWITELIRRATRPAPVWNNADDIALNPQLTRPAPPVLDLTAIINLYDLGTGKTVFRLALADGSPVRIKRAGATSKYAGCLFADGGTFESGYAKIDPAGRLTVYRAAEPIKVELVELLTAFAADPAGVAGAYGKLTGNCTFCTKTLTDARSVAVGYGPTCATKFGLPWGGIDRPAH